MWYRVWKACRIEVGAGQKQGQGQGLNSVLLDWALWEEGEAKRKSHRPHHRVLTVYY